ncbi:hydroperoxide isomerase ALOXE3-like [Polymixia lowei]
MAVYKVEVTTGDMVHAGRFDSIFITLIGTEGESKRTELDNFGVDFTVGKTGSYTVKSTLSLGKLLLVKVEKDPYFLLPENEWFCSKIVVTTPEEDVILFPCHRWVTRGEYVELRGGRDYVSEHWMEDDFYGFQFLNATNPSVIQRCLVLPSNFPVTEEMVKPFLEDGSSLQMEMEKGNIFLCDYKRMDGLPTREYDGEPLPLAAGLCLLYNNPENKLIPIAIQLNQQPSEQNPIFLPTDPENDWLLAKMFVKNADTIQYQAVYHLMNTHFLAEGFALATLRNLPAIHPLYKLLIPHFCYTLQDNTSIRKQLFKSSGGLSESSPGNEGLIELMRRAFSETTYSALCLPENITARGLESISNFYYRDDGLKLWNIINSFVKAIVEYYYPSDSDVCRDSELQAWINDIFTHSFLGKSSSGIPEGFHTVEEVIKFITMVIFRVSGQHASVQKGQFDYNSWMPNNPLLLRKPPPTTKGQSSMKTILETLPNIGETVNFMTMGWVLTEKYSDTVFLGTYPVERFDEPAPKKMIQDFQAELSILSKAIAKRNSELVVPYNYLNPAQTLSPFN